MEVNFFRQHNARVSVIVFNGALVDRHTFEYPFMYDSKVLGRKLASVIQTKGMAGLKKVLYLTASKYKGKSEENLRGHFHPKEHCLQSVVCNFVCKETDVSVYNTTKTDKDIQFLLDYIIDTKTLTESTVFAFDTFNKTI